MMKILIGSLTYSLLNGVTISINRSIDGFNKKGIKTIIVSPDYGIGKTRKEHYLAPSSLITKSVGVLIGKEERTFGFGAYNKIKEINDEFNPDAYWLHTITWTPNAFERFIFKSKKPKVVFYHTMVEEYGRIYAGPIGATTMRLRSKTVCNKADSVIIPSEMMKRKLINYGVKTPIHVIPTGISIPKKQSTKAEICKKFGIDPSSKILLHVGRVSKEKNLEVLLKATKKINDLGFNAVALFVGPGDIEEMIEEAEELKIDDKVFFSGGLPKEEAQAVYGGADVFIFSSQTETQGLVIGEAMAAEIPVVALKSPIQEEVYLKEVAAVADNFDDFIEKLKSVLKNSEETKEMVKRAKIFVDKNFSEQTMIDKQVKIFEELIAQKDLK